MLSDVIIKYHGACSVPSSGMVTLEVFNVVGQKVRTLVDQTLSSGTHRFTLDAGSMSSGVYFYRLAFDGRVESRKMLLLK